MSYLNRDTFEIHAFLEIHFLLIFRLFQGVSIVEGLLKSLKGELAQARSF